MPPEVTVKSGEVKTLLERLSNIILRNDKEGTVNPEIAIKTELNTVLSLNGSVFVE